MNKHQATGSSLTRDILSSHIPSTIFILISVIGWGVTVETRFTALEVEQINADKTLDRIEQSLVRIEDKLDRKADK